MMLLNPYRFASAGGGGGGTPPAIGEYWAGQGGYYAGQINYADGRSFHLVLAEKAAETANRNYGYYNTVSGASSQDDGAYNQGVIEALGLTGGGSYPPTAFQTTAAWSKDGHDDFYLPALNELNLLYLNLAPGKTGQVALFATGGAQAFVANYYWSSTEISATHGNTRRFTNGSSLSQDKFNNAYARPIRRVTAS